MLDVVSRLGFLPMDIEVDSARGEMLILDLAGQAVRRFVDTNGDGIPDTQLQDFFAHPSLNLQSRLYNDLFRVPGTRDIAITRFGTGDYSTATWQLRDADADGVADFARETTYAAAFPQNLHLQLLRPLDLGATSVVVHGRFDSPFTLTNIADSQREVLATGSTEMASGRSTVQLARPLRADDLLLLENLHGDRYLAYLAPEGSRRAPLLIDINNDGLTDLVFVGESKPGDFVGNSGQRHWQAPADLGLEDLDAAKEPSQRIHAFLANLDGTYRQATRTILNFPDPGGLVRSESGQLEIIYRGPVHVRMRQLTMDGVFSDVAADLDGDSDARDSAAIVRAHGSAQFELHVFRSQQGQLVRTQAIPLPGDRRSPTRLVVEDVDHDGDLDLRVRNLQGHDSVAFNDGHGNFSAVSNIPQRHLGLQDVMPPCVDETNTSYNLRNEIIYFSAPDGQDAVWVEANGMRGLQRSACVLPDGTRIPPDTLIYSGR